MVEPVVLVTGASGLLGTLLLQTAPDLEIVPLVHRRPIAHPNAVSIDLRDGAAVQRIVERIRPTMILHAAYAKDGRSIVDATRNVVEAASGTGSYVLQVSTDAVFVGDGRPRDERALPDPISDYGRWKARAESSTMDRSSENSIVRLPLVCSLDPEDHIVDRIRQGASCGRPTTWFGDEIRQPALGLELAAALWRIALLDPEQRAGTWHLPGPERLSRIEIARRVVATLALDPRTIRADHTPVDAARPRDLHLLGDRARRTIGWQPSAVYR